MSEPAKNKVIQKKRVPLLVKKAPRSQVVDGITVIKSKKTIVKFLAPDPDPVPIQTKEPEKYKPEVIDGITVIKKDRSRGLQIDIDDFSPPEEPDDVSITNNTDVQDLLARIDPKGKCDKEELIDKLETVKYELTKRISKCKTDDTLLGQYKNVMDLLHNVKNEDLVRKVDKNVQDRTIIIQKFKKTTKKLTDHEFDRIIDLTAPKAQREPEPGLVLWKYSKDVKYKDAKYHRPSREKEKQFSKAHALKKMPSNIKQKLDDNYAGNLQSLGIRKYHGDLLQYQKYNPLDHRGLNYF